MSREIIIYSLKYKGEECKLTWEGRKKLRTFVSSGSEIVKGYFKEVGTVRVENEYLEYWILKVYCRSKK